MSLEVVRTLFPNDSRILQVINCLLANGDVRLLESDGAEVAEWRWRELFDEAHVVNEMSHYQLEITEQGSRRIA